MKTKWFLSIILMLLLFVTFVIFIFSYSPTRKFNFSDEPSVTIGVIASDQKAIAQYQTLAEYLHEYTGKNWRVEPVSDAGSFIEQIENHKIKSAFVGSAVGYRIIRHNLGVPVARAEKSGISTYKALIITRKDSGYNSMENLQNKRFAYIDINMSSGYTYPIYLLKLNGYDPDSFFSSMSFLKTTENVVKSVISKQFDGGAVKSSDYADIIKQHPEYSGMLEIIAQDGPFPENTFMMSLDFDPGFINLVQTALLDMNNHEKGKYSLEKMNADRFIKTDVKDFSFTEIISNFAR